eukprot:g13297.t1
MLASLRDSFSYPASPESAAQQQNNVYHPPSPVSFPSQVPPAPEGGAAYGTFFDRKSQLLTVSEIERNKQSRKLAACACCSFFVLILLLCCASGCSELCYKPARPALQHMTILRGAGAGAGAGGVGVAAHMEALGARAGEVVGDDATTSAAVAPAGAKAGAENKSSGCCYEASDPKEVAGGEAPAEQAHAQQAAAIDQNRNSQSQEPQQHQVLVGKTGSKEVKATAPKAGGAGNGSGSDKPFTSDRPADTTIPEDKNDKPFTADGRH